MRDRGLGRGLLPSVESAVVVEFLPSCLSSISASSGRDGSREVSCRNSVQLKISRAFSSINDAFILET